MKEDVTHTCFCWVLQKGVWAPLTVAKQVSGLETVSSASSPGHGGAGRGVQSPLEAAPPTAPAVPSGGRREGGEVQDRCGGWEGARAWALQAEATELWGARGPWTLASPGAKANGQAKPLGVCSAAPPPPPLRLSEVRWGWPWTGPDPTLFQQAVPPRTFTPSILLAVNPALGARRGRPTLPPRPPQPSLPRLPQHSVSLVGKGQGR